MVRNANIGRLSTLLLFVTVAICGCTRERVRTPYVARVDAAELSLAELAAMCDTTGINRQQTRTCINQWVVTELLYQEAVRRGIVDREDLRQQVEAARRHLAITALLDRELGTNDTLLMPEPSLKAYFDTSAAAFVLREDVALASYALFAERDAANTFRSLVIQGTPWHEALQAAQRDSATHSQPLLVADHQYFTRTTLYPEELWKLARTLRRNEVSFVLKTNAGYYVLQVHGNKRQGETPDFAYVREEVRTRLLIGIQRTRYEQLVRDLRGRHAVEVLLDSTMGLRNQPG